MTALKWRQVAFTASFLAVCVGNAADDSRRLALARYAVERGESTWRKVETLSERLTSREIFTYALALCEARASEERLPRLFEVAGRMQDKAPESAGYGNFRWSWSDGAVLDYNAVEFCMQGGAILWQRHAERLPADVRKTLLELLDFSVQGCLRHRVPESYTNIALMNAQNLILLGEGLARPKVAEEGYTRLTNVTIYTSECGIHEYDSPTYYGVDLDCLGLLHAFTRNDQARKQAEALLELFWTDIALNWFTASSRLGGARSRDYDYLRGHGMLESHLHCAGWLPGEPNTGVHTILLSLIPWRPPQRLRELCETRFPRFVQQQWGISATQFRTHFVQKDVSLSIAGAAYGAMDLPLTVDLAGDSKALRCYFIPDARRDPYGRKKVPAGPHQKTLHLRPFWVGAQRRGDALGLVAYRDRDYPPTPASLESHIVFPLDVDSLWVGEEAVPLDAAEPFVVDVPPGQPVVLRKGTAAVGMRVPWARGLDGTASPAAVVFDGNPHGACRLTVAHHSFWGIDTEASIPGASFWVRVGSSLDSNAAFERWLRQFADASAKVDSNGASVRVHVTTPTGPLAVEAEAPFYGSTGIEPAPQRIVLGLDGEDLGKRILSQLPAVSERVAAREAIGPLVVAGTDARNGFFWEAEAGDVAAPMRVDEDDQAFESRYAWTPGEPGQRGGGSLGRITFVLDIREPGDYVLWGRVLAPTQDDDSFLIRVATGVSEPVQTSEWHTGVHEDWEWTPVCLHRSNEPAAIRLPKGRATIELRTRENGTKIDRLFITSNRALRPQ